MNPQRFDAYIRARDTNECALKQTGCTHTCDSIVLVQTIKQLEALHRDPNNPDNWCCACTNCAPPGQPEEGS